MAGDERDGGSLGFDVTVAHPARVYNYLLGGKTISRRIARPPGR
jgi:S-adenosyl methyltransferase